MSKIRPYILRNPTAIRRPLHYYMYTCQKHGTYFICCEKHPVSRCYVCDDEAKYHTTRKHRPKFMITEMGQAHFDFLAQVRELREQALKNQTEEERKADEEYQAHLAKDRNRG